MLGDTGESVADRLGGLGSAVAVGQRGQKGVARDPFGEGRDCRAVTGADNQIAFPVTVVGQFDSLTCGFTQQTAWMTHPRNWTWRRLYPFCLAVDHLGTALECVTPLAVTLLTLTNAGGRSVPGVRRGLCRRSPLWPVWLGGPPQLTAQVRRGRTQTKTDQVDAWVNRSSGRSPRQHVSPRPTFWEDTEDLGVCWSLYQFT